MPKNIEALPRPVERPFNTDLEDIQERVHDLDVQARAFIRQNPVLTLAGAVTIGFLIGKLVTR